MIIAVILSGAALSVLAALFFIARTERRHHSESLTDGHLEPCVFLYQDGKLIDATTPARTILSSCPGDSLDSLKSWLSRYFDALPQLDDDIALQGRAELLGKDGTGLARLRLAAETTTSGALRLTLIRPDSEAAGIVVDALSQQAREDELALLREVVNHAPILISHSNEQDEISWVNATYLNLTEELEPQATQWPLPDIFRLEPNTAGPSRARAQDNSGKPTGWYECHRHEFTHGTITYGIEADAKVQSEEKHREFLQTLTKTFADLPIGLAIFDRDRQLLLFNPALTDLTGLSAGFLAGRPTLDCILDQLRELRMLPERRDYHEWRRRFVSLETTDVTGQLAEKWHLPGDRTYRVTGRPYAGGNAVFLFEDLTPEVTSIRDLRGELKKLGDVMDGLGEALIVFDALGQVVMSSSAYAGLWGEAPAAVADALETWRGEWAAAPGLAELERRLNATVTPESCRGIIFGPRGAGMLSWTLSALPGGRRLVRFAPTPSASETQGEPRKQTSSTHRVAGSF